MTDCKKSQPSPEMVEGPFYSNGGEYRSDLREDQPGQKLDLTITVVNAKIESRSPGLTSTCGIATRPVTIAATT